MFGTSKLLTPHQIRVSIIERFVKPESLKEKGAWAREMKILKELMERYPDEAFWLKSELMSFTLNSLAYFKSEDGAKRLEADYIVFHYEPAAPIDNVDTQPESSYDIPTVPVKRPLTISQFIKQQSRNTSQTEPVSSPSI